MNNGSKHAERASAQRCHIFYLMKRKGDEMVTQNRVKRYKSKTLHINQKYYINTRFLSQHRRSGVNQLTPQELPTANCVMPKNIAKVVQLDLSPSVKYPKPYHQLLSVGSTTSEFLQRTE